MSFDDNDAQLLAEVFPRMAADEISTILISDPLIKSFGARYSKFHREKHLVSVTSQKIRTLARLIIQIKKEEPNINNLQDFLSPKYFDLIVKCTKIISGYNTLNDTFQTPSIVLKIGSSLKQCCEIAELNMLKSCDNLVFNETQNNKQKSIKNIRSIIEKQWSYELSTNACKDIYQKKWNKPAYLPLTSDIKIFRDHLINIQNKCITELRENSFNLKAYREFQESVLAQLILLNRRRSGEVQRIFIETYLNAPTEISQEEIELSLSEMEREPTKKFKRIIIRGKRGRGNPIMFTTNLQKAIQLLIEIRKVTDFIDKNNPYLFALPFTMSSLRGTDCIRNLSQVCGAKSPEHLTSTKLRKQVATVAQILNLSDGDIEQLSTFLGHSKDVHKSYYRLSEELRSVNCF